jgi:phage major head subunit gpT-like protein
MDISKPGVLESLFRTLNTYFQAGISLNTGTPVDFAISEFQSSGPENWYPWMDFIDGFKELVGERQFGNVKTQLFKVLNRTFGEQVSLKYETLKDNNENGIINIYGPLVQMMAMNWPILQRELFFEVLSSNPKTWTDTELFGTHILDDKGKIKITNLTSSTMTKANFVTAITAAAKWTYVNGKLVRPRWTHALCGQGMFETVKAIVQDNEVITVNAAGDINPGSAVVAAAARPNPYAGYFEVVRVEDIATNAVYLLDCSKPVKPIARQIREVPAPKMDTDPSFVEKQMKTDFFATARAAAAPTFPWLAYAFIP